MNRRRRGVLTPIALRELYHQQGEFSVKVMIAPDESPHVEDVRVNITNSDGRPMDFTYKRWGTKLNLTFKIDDTTPDGVSIIDVDLTRRDGRSSTERFSFWVVR